MEKIDYKHGKFIILTSEVEASGFTREDYEEWCKDNGITPGNDDDFYEYCAEETQLNYEADMDNIESCKQYNVPVVVTGTLGLWWGRPEIRPERFESVADAIHRFLVKHVKSPRWMQLLHYQGIIQEGCCQAVCRV